MEFLKLMPFIILSAAHENISKVFLKTIETKNCSSILGVFPRTPNTRRHARSAGGSCEFSFSSSESPLLRIHESAARWAQFADAGE